MLWTSSTYSDVRVVNTPTPKGIDSLSYKPELLRFLLQVNPQLVNLGNWLAHKALEDS